MFNFKKPILSALVLVALFSGCSSSSSSSSTASTAHKVTGTLTGLTSASLSDSFAKSASYAPATTTLGEADEIWVISMIRQTPHLGATQVQLDYANFEDSKQIFPIDSAGNFVLQVEEVCEKYNSVYSECLGYIAVIVDTTLDREDRILGYLALDAGDSSLLNLPFQELTNDLDLGTMALDENTTDEMVGNTVDETVTASFADLTVSAMQEIAKSDDYMKVYKNYYINNITSASNNTAYINQIFWDLSATFDNYTIIDNIENQGTIIQVDPQDSAPSDITDGEYYLRPPSATNTLLYVNELYVTSTPIDTYAGITLGELSYSPVDNVPEGTWTVVDNRTGLEYGFYELDIARPFDVAKNVITTFIPRVKANLDIDGKLTSVDIKWYFYDGVNYKEVTDTSAFAKNVSELTIRVDSTSGQESIMLLGENPTFAETTIKHDTSTVMIYVDYGFYQTRIEAAFRYYFI